MSSPGRVSRADFAHFERNAQHVTHGALFSLSVFALPPERRSAITCIVTKKVAVKATRRNMIRRLCRESARTQLAKVAETCALVFRAKRATLRATSAEIREDVRSIVDKVAAR